MIPYEDLVAHLTSWRMRHGLPVGRVHTAPPAPVHAAPPAPAPLYSRQEAPPQASEGFVHVGTGEFDLAEEGTMVGGQAAPLLEQDGEMDVDADAVIDEEHLE